MSRRVGALQISSSSSSRGANSKFIIALLHMQSCLIGIKSTRIFAWCCIVWYLDARESTCITEKCKKCAQLLFATASVQRFSKHGAEGPQKP